MIFIQENAFENVVWKNGSHFVSASMCSMPWWHSQHETRSIDLLIVKYWVAFNQVILWGAWDYNLKLTWINTIFLFRCKTFICTPMLLHSGSVWETLSPWRNVLLFSVINTILLKINLTKHNLFLYRPSASLRTQVLLHTQSVWRVYQPGKMPVYKWRAPRPASWGL